MKSIVHITLRPAFGLCLFLSQFASGRSTILTDNVILVAAGGILTAAGIGYMVWASIHLQRATETHRVATDGPFRFTRHPIYASIYVFSAGLGLAFFSWVWFAVISLLLTGYPLLFGVFGTMANAPIFVHLMQALGLIMMAIFAHVFFAPYRRLKQAVSAEDWEAGGRQLAQIRRMVGINLVLGLMVVIMAGGGRMMM